jgi:ribosomal protein S18 acetylase RimI-like enzyme
MTEQVAIVAQPELADALTEDLGRLYEEIYREPPYKEGASDVARFVDRYRVHVREPGFRLALTRDQGLDLSGFAYGLTLQPDTSWWDEVTGASLSAAFTREDGRRTFSIVELAVRAAHRRRGIARALHAALLEDNPAERVTLVALPEAEPAMRLYAALGYRPVGPGRSRSGVPPYRCLVLDTRACMTKA